MSVLASDPSLWEHVIVAAIVVAGTVAIGIGLRVLLSKLTDHADDTERAWDDLVYGLLRDLSLMLPTALGIWVALQIIRFTPHVRGIAGHILLAVLILAIAVAIARFVAGFVSDVALAKSNVGQSATIFVNIARVAVIGIGFLILLQSLGVSITPLLGALGVGGLAVALALQDTLANLFAGIHILVSKKVQSGDFVSLDSGEEGWIVDINWRNTTIRQIPGNLVIVPNSHFADAIITNYARPINEMNITVEAGVGYHSDLDHVERIAVEVGREVMTELDAGVTDHVPKVRFHTFGSSSIDFRVILRITEFPEQYFVASEYVKRLHKRFKAENIEMPYPVRTVVQPDGAYPNGEAPAEEKPAARARRRTPVKTKVTAKSE